MTRSPPQPASVVTCHAAVGELPGPTARVLPPRAEQRWAMGHGDPGCSPGASEHVMATGGATSAVTSAAVSLVPASVVTTASPTLASAPGDGVASMRAVLASVTPTVPPPPSLASPGDDDTRRSSGVRAPQDAAATSSDPVASSRP